MDNGETLVFNGLVELGSKMTAQIQPNGCRITDADIDAALNKFPEFIEVARQRPDCLLAVMDTNTGKTKRLEVLKIELPIEQFMYPNPHHIKFCSAGGKVVGTLAISDDGLDFDGDATESAMLFMKNVITTFNHQMSA